MYRGVCLCNFVACLDVRKYPGKKKSNSFSAIPWEAWTGTSSCSRKGDSVFYLDHLKNFWARNETCILCFVEKKGLVTNKKCPIYFALLPQRTSILKLRIVNLYITVTEGSQTSERRRLERFKTWKLYQKSPGLHLSFIPEHMRLHLSFTPEHKVQGTSGTKN